MARSLATAISWNDSSIVEAGTDRGTSQVFSSSLRHFQRLAARVPQRVFRSAQLPRLDQLMVTIAPVLVYFIAFRSSPWSPFSPRATGTHLAELRAEPKYTECAMWSRWLV